MPVPNSIAILSKLYGKSSVGNTSTNVPTYITHHFLQFLSVIFIHKWVMLSSHKKAPIFSSAGITAIILSLFIYFFLCFLIYLKSLAPDQSPMWSFSLAVGNSRALLGRSCGGQLSSPPHTQCSVRVLPSRTGVGCSQGLGLRGLHSEDSLLEVSAEAPPRSFCQHLLIGGLSLSTFPHSDSVCVHS